MSYDFLALKNMDKSDKKDNNLSSKTRLETTVIASNLSKGSLSESCPIKVIGDTLRSGLMVSREATCDPIGPPI